MSISIYGPIVFLRCKKCGRKTDHVLICYATITKGEIEETYECQQCGKTRKIFELISMKEPEKLTVRELRKKIKAKSVIELEEGLKELRKKWRFF